MPELPEVETVRRGLEPVMQGADRLVTLSGSPQVIIRAVELMIEKIEDVQAPASASAPAASPC